MPCCSGARKGTRTNGKICPRCGWVMHRIHKYNTAKKQVDKYWLCSNKAFKGKACAFKEQIK